MSQNQQTGKISKVFISYSHLDRKRIQPYLEELTRLSIPYWWDKGLHAGDHFNNEIAKNIEASEGFVLFLSQHSAESWFVDDELTYARNLHKRIMVVHLEADIQIPGGIKLHLGNLHQLFGYELGPQACSEDVAKSMREDRIPPAEPIEKGLRNHLSELLNCCRESLEHLSSQMGVHDLEKDIDPDLFCPVWTTGEKDRKITDLYTEICREDHKHILLQADGGLGKTYTFLYTMKRMLDCDRPCAYIPCYLFTGTERTELGLILDTLCRMYLMEQEPNEAQLNRFFREQTDRTFVLFLDGYNEAVAKDQLAAEIVHLSNAFPRIKIVFSSRYSDPVFTSYLRYTMHGLNSKAVKTLLHEYGRDFSRLHFSLQKLLMTPMFLRLYLRMGQEDRETDTAAELMNRERERILDSIRPGISALHMEWMKPCLNEAFPGFVRQEYCLRGRSLSFYGSQLKQYLREHLPSPETAERAFQFLLEYSVIFRSDERLDIYAYQHEHFRDYWTAYAVFRKLMESREFGASGREKAEAVMAALSGDYSDIVLRYIGELAQVGSGNNRMAPVLDSLRRQEIQDDELWLSAGMADATAKVIEIYRMVQEGRMIGMNLDGLNLSETRLNEAHTCTRTHKTTFHGSLITERTFIASLHESAPRRLELMRLGGRDYLVSVSNIDLLISALPEMDRKWRFAHTDLTGSPVATGTLLVSASLGNSLLAVDSEGAAWEWRFEAQDGIPFASPAIRHEEAEPAVKVFPWSDEEGPLIGLQRRDGVILMLGWDKDAPEGEPALVSIDDGIRVSALAEKNTRKTLTASPQHLFFCWAEGREDGIHIMEYSLREADSAEVCLIPETELFPDYMICVGSEQASREEKGMEYGASDQDGSLLILTATGHERTRLYQIRLPQSSIGKAQVTRLDWPDGREELTNDYKVTQRTYNRINAMSFSDGHMLLAASDGHVYHYVYDGAGERFVPDAGTPRVKLAKPTFSVEDVLYLSADRIAAATVDRRVHLIDAQSMFEIRKLRGYFDGLRRLLPVNDRTMLATSYDGAVLELQKGSERWVCRDKIPVGEWCWALEKISGSIYAAGYLSGLVLVDLDRDEILFHLSGLEQKVEHLLYLPEAGNRLLAMSKNGARVFQVTEEKGRLQLEERGWVKLPKEAPCCYWSLKQEGTVFLALCDADEGHPQIGCLSLSRLSEEQTPAIIPTGSDYGRIRDLHVFGHHLLACGMCGENRVPQVRIFDLSPGWNFRLEHNIDGFPGFLVHSAVYTEGEKAWRLAVIDGPNRMLHQIRLTEGAGGALEDERIASCSFPGILCDVAFDSGGDLLLTCLDGGLYRVSWGSDRAEELFRNKSYLLTFGTDLSDLYQPVKADSPLGRILTDFGNRLTTGRKFRRNG